MITRASVQFHDETVEIDLSKPIDISIPLRFDGKNPNAWYVEQPKIEPVKFGDWVGSVAEGGDVNFKNIWFSPHANGTHTETVGHVTKELVSINEHLKTFFFFTEVVSITPEQNGDDMVITKSMLTESLTTTAEAIVIRTLPNSDEKLLKEYSHTNPTYMEPEAAAWLRDRGIKHLLIDLPSIDKEKDDGALKAHHIFWDTENDIRYDATITEFIYVPNTISDGTYVLNLQIASFENDASPSKPVLYKIE
ncbi:MAG: cyclase family protein [Flavobacteriaceae bacterium]|nr:cyclase family protein [Flavobacteriaceae bacterium]